MLPKIFSGLSSPVLRESICILKAETSNRVTDSTQKELLKYQSTAVAKELQESVQYAAESIADDMKTLVKDLDDLDVSVGLPSVGSGLANW